MRMVIMVGWNKGVKEWFAQFEQPVLKEVDISGINSPNADPDAGAGWEDPGGD